MYKVCFCTVSAVCARVFNLVIMTSCFYDSDCDFAFILIFDNYYFLCFGHSNYYNYSGYYSFLYEKISLDFLVWLFPYQSLDINFVWFNNNYYLISLAQRPGSHPPPPALGQPVFVNSNGYIHNNGYQPYAGYYGAPGQAFYPSPTPGTYPAYPPPGTALCVVFTNSHHAINADLIVNY